MPPASDNPFGMTEEVLRDPRSHMRYGARAAKSLGACRAAVDDAACVLGVLPSTSMGFREIVRGEGMERLRKNVLKRGWASVGWELRFEEFRSLEKATLVEEQFSSAMNLEYTDGAGARRGAALSGVWGQVPWMMPVLMDLLAPGAGFVVLAENAKVLLEERRSSKSSRYEAIDTIKGRLVAIGPFVTESDDGARVVWGPVLALVPRDLREWRGKFEDFMSGSTGLFGTIADLSLAPALVNKAASFVFADLFGASRVTEVVDLPVDEGFLAGRKPSFGSPYDEAGRTHRWTWRDGTWDDELYLLRNWWVWRCARWWGEMSGVGG